ncbi:MAG: sigma-70 family RNA polymerase sigma factor [Ruminococcaceae bacterium]|nr:sigma-70 family RNA polymerase sigma factor [Oscillospiraceae bacterium]
MVEQKNAREKFIEENLGLVHSLCHRFKGRGIEYDDLYQAGCVGLVKATDAFDHSRGLCFSTYAVPVILGEIRRLFRDGGAVKVSRSLKELSLKVTRLSSQMTAVLGREPTVSELSERLGCSKEEISEAISASRPVVSLTYEDDDGVSEYELPTTSVEEELADKLLISGALESLSELERKIVSCRFYHGMTQSKTAELLSMSQVQISRNEKRILQKLKPLLT